MTARCHGCDAPLAVDQRWCVACGARQAGAGAGTLLFGGPQQPAGDVAPRNEGPGPSGRSDPALRTARRRRAAVPVALASLVGLVVVTGTSPASLAGSAHPPFTVVLPAREAQQVAQAPPTEEPAEPVAEAPVAETPVAETPVAERPAAEEEKSAPDTRDDEKTPPARDPAPDSPIKHVFLIALGAADVHALARDTTAAPYLAGTLAKSGTLLSGYRTVARGGLADRIALISGQGPTAQTLDDCTTYGDLSPAEPLPGGQTGGDGCVYGSETQHLGDQLLDAKRTWKAYVEPAEGPARASAVGLGPIAVTARASDAASGPVARAAAACDAGTATTRRNPFLWFRDTLGSGDCDAHNVPLTQLKRDLSAAETTSALSWIASDAQQGSADADSFLARVVPQIQNSPAYADGGLILIVGDQPPALPEAPAPAAATPATPTTYANVGDAAAAGAGVPVGALLISPYTPSGRIDTTPADAFTLLRTLQQIYDVDPLGYAAADGVKPLPDKLFSVAP